MSLMYRILAVLVLVGLIAAGALSVRKAYSERAALKQQLATEKARAVDFEARVQQSYELANRRSQDAERIRNTTKEIIREVEVRIPADACPLPPDWRVLHDAAAAGQGTAAPR